MKVLGLHHITAIARGAQTNLLFYTRVLGLRLVKRTVNFDAPDTYHLYYGNELGSPGSLLTFFPFQDAAPGRAGTGMTQTTAFTVPEVGFESWMHRLAEGGHDFEGPFRRFGALMLAIRDAISYRPERKDQRPDPLRPPLRRIVRVGEGSQGAPLRPGYATAAADELRAFQGIGEYLAGLPPTGHFDRGFVGTVRHHSSAGIGAIKRGSGGAGRRAVAGKPGRAGRPASV